MALDDDDRLAGVHEPVEQAEQLLDVGDSARGRAQAASLPLNTSEQHLQPTLKCLHINTVSQIRYLCIEQVAQVMMIDYNRDKVMSNELEPKPTSSQPVVYQVRIKGHLGSQWTDWFGGLTVTLEENGDTLLTGPVIDQAALHGLLKKVRDLGMPLVSVGPLESDEANASEVKD